MAKLILGEGLRRNVLAGAHCQTVVEEQSVWGQMQQVVNSWTENELPEISRINDATDREARLYTGLREKLSCLQELVHGGKKEPEKHRRLVVLHVYDVAGLDKFEKRKISARPLNNFLKRLPQVVQDVALNLHGALEIVDFDPSNCNDELGTDRWMARGQCLGPIQRDLQSDEVLKMAFTPTAVERLNEIVRVAIPFEMLVEKFAIDDTETKDELQQLLENHVNGGCQPRATAVAAFLHDRCAAIHAFTSTGTGTDEEKLRSIVLKADRMFPVATLVEKLVTEFRLNSEVKARLMMVLNKHAVDRWMMRNAKNEGWGGRSGPREETPRSREEDAKDSFEFSFGSLDGGFADGSGLFLETAMRRDRMYRHDSAYILGVTDLSDRDIQVVLAEMEKEYLVVDYSVPARMCLTFSQELAQRVGAVFRGPVKPWDTKEWYPISAEAPQEAVGRPGFISFAVRGVRAMFEP